MVVIILTMILTKRRRRKRMLNDDIVGEETRNDRRKHKPRVTGGFQWESGALLVLYLVTYFDTICIISTISVLVAD